MTQWRPGGIKIFYKQEAGGGHVAGVGVVETFVLGRPHKVLLSYKKRENSLFTHLLSITLCSLFKI